MATRDFRTTGSFTASTAIAIYAGWTSHGAAFISAVVLDPFRVEFSPTLAVVVGGSLIGIGIALFVLGVRKFQSFAQITGTDPGDLITSGVYAFSRNPQYTGWIVLLFGGAVAARSPIALALGAVVVVAMRVWIPQEERNLEKEFGDQYLDYRRRVPRFLQLTPKSGGSQR